MSELIDTTQMYLRTIYELIEAGIEPRRARIVERLSQAGPTVSQTVARMERDDLLKLTPERTIELSASGYREGRDVMRRHRLAETFIMKILGIGFSHAHDEACRWEHVMSDDAADRLRELLGEPQLTPYGTPIPSGDTNDVQYLEHFGIKLPVAVQHGVRKAKFVLVDELAQRDSDFLMVMEQSGVQPGTEVTLSCDGDDYVLEGPRGALTVIADYGQSLRVTELALR